jgi:hypothetical protein
MVSFCYTLVFAGARCYLAVVWVWIISGWLRVLFSPLQQASIRDVVRCMKLFDFFTKRPNAEFFVGEPEGTTTQLRALSRAWRALVLSIAVTYYLRLDSHYEHKDGSVKDFRRMFLERFQQAVGRPAGQLGLVVRQSRHVAPPWCCWRLWRIYPPPLPLLTPVLQEACPCVYLQASSGWMIACLSQAV